MSEQHVVRLEALDGLRGVLSLSVVCSHAGFAFLWPVMGTDKTSLWVALMGVLFVASRCAVLAFFCLSGFVIALSAERNVLRHGRFNAADFAFARAIRLLPPLLLTMAVTAGLARLLHARQLDLVPTTVDACRNIFVTRLGDQFAAIASLGALGDLRGELNRPLWTLTYEIQLYATVAVLLFALKSMRHFVFRALALFGLSCYLWLVWTHALERDRNDMGVQVVCYLAFTLGWLTYRGRAWLNRWPLPKILAGCMVAALLFAALHGFFHDPRGFAEESPTLMSAELLFAAASCCVLVLASQRTARASLVQLGGYSYTLYIVHFPLLTAAYFWLYSVLPTYPPLLGFALMLLAIPAVAGCARLLAWAIERPASQRRWLERQWAEPGS